MDRSAILERLKSAPVWAAILAIVNLIMSYLGVSPQVIQIVNAVIALAAFVLFGVQVNTAVKAARAARNFIKSSQV